MLNFISVIEAAPNLNAYPTGPVWLTQWNSENDNVAGFLFKLESFNFSLYLAKANSVTAPFMMS